MSKSKNDSTVVEETPEVTFNEIHVCKSKKELLMEKLKPFMDEEATKMVKGRFRNYEVPGASATIICDKYPGISMFKMDMMDDTIYEIPLYVARFLNGIDVTAPCKRINTCSYPVSGYKWEQGKEMPNASKEDGSGGLVPVIHTAKHVRRYGFESTQFDAEV